MGFVSTAVSCVMGEVGAMGGGVGILQLRAGKHTQERFSLDEHNTTSKDECEIRLGPTCSWHHAVIAICKSNTSVWRLLPPRELPSATSVSRRISSTSQWHRDQSMDTEPTVADSRTRHKVRPLCWACTRVTTNFAMAFCDCLVGGRVRATMSYASRLCWRPTISTRISLLERLRSFQTTSDQHRLRCCPCAARQHPVQPSAGRRLKPRSLRGLVPRGSRRGDPLGISMSHLNLAGPL
jgi:hypothetical protein